MLSHCSTIVQTTMKGGKIIRQAEAVGLKMDSLPLQSNYRLAETVFAGD
jgi:hypothetical protein